ncbi:MAG: holo-ACP synthase [Pseudomonadota bacterium]
MILGIGTDIIDAGRIEKLYEQHPARFLEKYFSKAEHAIFEERKKNNTHILFLSKRFAAKEALAKATGLGIRAGLSMADISVEKDDLGKPIIHLLGDAPEIIAQQLGSEHLNIHLSLSDEPPYAQAYVIIEDHSQSKA